MEALDRNVERHSRIEALERDVVTLGRALDLCLLGEQVIHGLSYDAIKEVVAAFKSVFPEGSDDPRIRARRNEKP